MDETTRALIERHGLAPHPEGGHYRRVHASACEVEVHGRRRPAMTAIRYLLAPGEASADVIAGFEAQLRIAKSRVERFWLRRLSEFAEVAFEGPKVGCCIAGDDAWVDRIASLSADRVAIGAQTWHHTPAWRDVDPNICIGAEPDDIGGLQNQFGWHINTACVR